MAQTQQDEREELPQSFPETPPPQQVDQSFTLQAIMELQKSTSGLEEAIKHLTAAVEAQGKTLNWVRNTMVFAAGALFILGILSRALLSKLDVLLAFIRSLPPP